jgi:tellurite resistance protein TerC
MRRVLSVGYGAARKIVVAAVGGTLVLIGVAMLVLPGPAIVVIPAGIAVLALEFAWARRWLRIVRQRISGVGASDPTPPSAPGR